MRAAVFRGAGRPLVVEEIPDPQPGPGEAVIEVGRCGICGSDLHMTSGHSLDYPSGTILGHEYAGTVVAVGDGVSRVRVGDRVTAMPAKGCGHCELCASGYPLACQQMQGMIGGFGQFLRIPEAGAVLLPQTLSITDGALVEPLAVGLHGVRMAALTPGARVLVVGPGSVGLAAIYWARLLGAGRIVAASRSERRREPALAMGADAFEPLGADDAQRINAALGGPPEVVFECAGASGLMQKCVDLVQPGGLVVSLGFCGEPDPIVPAAVTWKRVTLKFSFGYDLRDFEHSADALDRGHVAPRSMVTETIGLDQLPDRFEALRRGGDAIKIHVDPWKA
jgi:(R,R)-butanediol dehydrogenase/meso-butanediol dehydrogenase/diacetyl reductase